MPCLNETSLSRDFWSDCKIGNSATAGHVWCEGEVYQLAENGGPHKESLRRNCLDY